MVEVNGARNRAGQSIEDFPIRPDRLGDLVRMIAEGRISGKIGKQLFEMMLTNPSTPEALVQEHGLMPIDDEASLRALAREVIAANPGPAAEVRPERSAHSPSSWGRR